MIFNKNFDSTRTKIYLHICIVTRSLMIWIVQDFFFGVRECFFFLHNKPGAKFFTLQGDLKLTVDEVRQTLVCLRQR